MSDNEGFNRFAQLVRTKTRELVGKVDTAMAEALRDSMPGCDTTVEMVLAHDEDGTAATVKVSVRGLEGRGSCESVTFHMHSDDE